MSALPAPYAAAHASPRGPGDARPTALQIVRDCGLGDGSLAGNVMLVTGCTSGIGPETARALHATGADVYMTARDPARAADLAASMRAAGHAGRVEVLRMELAELASVREAAGEFLRRSGGRCHVLVNNAGE